MKKFLSNHPLLMVVALLVSPQLWANDDAVKRGEYIAKLGDCSACHTAPEGQAYAGGLKFATPFGELYSTNITSHKDKGIGDYSLQDFKDALREGKGKHGRLYPAMPFTSYALVSDQDISDLYAYFMQVPAADVDNKDNDLNFPANFRFGLIFWSWLNHDPQPFKPIANKPEAYNRGAYIVNGLGHCGECHTTRTKTFGIDKDRIFMGQVIDGKYAPNITATELNRQGWTYRSLNDLFREGYSSKGTTFGGMFTLISHSMQHLTESDMKAVASYLLDQAELDVDAKTPQAKVSIDETSPGYELYEAHCAGCHGGQGQGVPNVAPAMVGNATLDQNHPFNTVAVLLKGIEPQRYSYVRAFGEMPGYETRLTDAQLLTLVNFLRESFTEQSEPVTQQQLDDIRDQIPDNAAH